jgi:hypothetical protein
MLKGLSHDVETGCRWYGCVNLCLERSAWVLLFILLHRRSLLQIKVLPAVLQKLMDS